MSSKTSSLEEGEEGEEREEGEEGEEGEEKDIQRIASRVSAKEQIASREKEQTVAKTQLLPEKEKIPEKEKMPEKKHFIRPLGKNKITIKTYDPPQQEKPDEKPIEIADLSIENGPAIHLVPQTVRIGKQVRIPKRPLPPK
jgi:hypothetical protein